MEPCYSIKTVKNLITTESSYRAGLQKLSLERNQLAVPYIEEAKALRYLANNKTYFKKIAAIHDLRIDLLPGKDNYINELVYRYLLTKGDALSGKARNLAGVLGERKFIRYLISVFNLAGINYKWKDNDTNTWLEKPKDDTGIEKRIKALYWNKGNKNRLLIMNTNVPAVNKNVDLLILRGTTDDLSTGKKSIIYNSNKYIALGELKCGIDPAGADEHWKTANSALNRIRTSFNKKRLKPKTFFIGAAIERSMSVEIFKHLKNGTLNNAANLTSDVQLASICEWIINL